MTDISTAGIPSPTDIHPEPFCSFCGALKSARRVLIASTISTAFICDICAPEAAEQAAAVVARQDEDTKHG